VINDTLIKVLVAIALILAAGWYVVSLKNQIKDKEAKIINLEAHILVQNFSIENSKKEKERIEDRLSNTAKENKKLSAALDKAKEEIDKREKAKSCEEAVSHLSNTASDVAIGWNLK